MIFNWDNISDRHTKTDAEAMLEWIVCECLTDKQIVEIDADAVEIKISLAGFDIDPEMFLSKVLAGRDNLVRTEAKLMLQLKATELADQIEEAIESFNWNEAQ